MLQKKKRHGSAASDEAATELAPVVGDEELHQMSIDFLKMVDFEKM